VAAESQHWLSYQTSGNKPDWAINGHHYGAFRQRLSWALRAGEEIGPNAPAGGSYARGRAIVLSYLDWSKSIMGIVGGESASTPYSAAPHHNTGMPDLEALWILEGNQDVKNHIWRFAADASYQHFKVPCGYVCFGTSLTEVRWIYEALYSFGAAVRMGIPYARPSGFPYYGSIASAATSWLDAGTKLIAHVDQHVPAGGEIPSPPHGGAEAYLFSSQLAVELLRWDEHVERSPIAVQVAMRIGRHLVDEWQRKAKPCLTYLSSDPAGCSPDTAGMHVWLGLALWQMTGEADYRAFADAHMTATSGVFWSGVKQFNQASSTGAQSYEAGSAGVNVR
jgi:hypothetical protein